MSSKLIDETFILLAKTVKESRDKGLCEVIVPRGENEVVNSFLKYAIDLSKDGVMPIVLSTELSAQISKYILNRSIDEDTLMALEIIKGLSEAVRAEDYDEILHYARNKASYEVYRYISDNIFNEYLLEDFEKNWNNENMFHDIIVMKKRSED